MRGQQVCATHGGSSPQARRAAERRLLEDEAQNAVERLDLDAHDADPIAAVRREMRRAVATVETLDEMAADLPLAAFLAVSLPQRRHLLDVARALAQLDPDTMSQQPRDALGLATMTPDERRDTMRELAFVACRRAKMSIVELFDAAYEREITSVTEWVEHTMRYDAHKKNARVVNDITRFETLALTALGFLRRLGLSLNDLAAVAAIEDDIRIDISDGKITRRHRATSEPIVGRVEPSPST